ncbi:MAG: hypothetical protein FJZ01_03955 [Candidatus Sericytochromatia bacterium]|nr:hypothetical protein [Candidatus Tanganyikabacteria bacterium]
MRWFLPAGICALGALAPACPALAGTDLLPASVAPQPHGFETGGWVLSPHLDIALGVSGQSGPRGGQAAIVQNWQMLRARRPLGPGSIELRLLSSLEPWTLPPDGVPQLLQAGESFRGKPLIDRQHPHDLVMELAGEYAVPLAPEAEFFVYGGPAGSPALGPPAYLHRASSGDNRNAPLGHHLQDSTHVAFGVVTVGARLGEFQVEASQFNGREPDEARHDLEFRPLDSYALRASYAPGDHVAMQVSTGYLAGPQALEPGDLLRTTASLLVAGVAGRGRRFAAALIWGRNEPRAGHRGGTLDSAGLEGALDLAPALRGHGRLEVVDRDELGLPGEAAHTVHRVGALTLGLAREIGDYETFGLAAGADLTFIVPDAAVAAAYGPNPLGFRVFLRLGPPVEPPAAPPIEHPPGHAPATTGVR